MVLAAGRGARMRPLTDHTPKPLLRVQGQPLLDWHLAALQRDGVQQVVVNTAWLGAQIPAHLDARWAGSALALHYSHEAQNGAPALETAGGIARALPQLGAAFWLAAGDVYAPDFVFDAAMAQAFAASSDLAHVWLVPNPSHHPQGDFGWQPDGPGSTCGRALNGPAADGTRWTYSTIALLKAALFAAPWSDLQPGNPQGVVAPLAPLLRAAMDAGRCGASCYTGRWTDVGTPERLAQLNADAPELK